MPGPCCNAGISPPTVRNYTPSAAEGTPFALLFALAFPFIMAFSRLSCNSGPFWFLTRWFADDIPSPIGSVCDGPWLAGFSPLPAHGRMLTPTGTVSCYVQFEGICKGLDEIYFPTTGTPKTKKEKNLWISHGLAGGKFVLSILPLGNLQLGSFHCHVKPLPFSQAFPLLMPISSSSSSSVSSSCPNTIVRWVWTSVYLKTMDLIV